MIRVTPMVRITFWLKWLILVLILRQSDGDSDQCSELQNEISRLEGHILKRINDLEYRNDVLEQLKIETHVPEAAFSSLKFEDYEFKCKLQQSDGVISSFKKQLEGNDEVVQSYNKKQVQQHTANNGIILTIESLNRTADVLCEKQNQLQTTIDGLTKTVEALNQTVKLLCGQLKDVCRYLFAAAKSGDVNTAKKWVNCSHDSCTTDDQERNTPLIYAAEKGHVEVVRVLLEGGANTQRAASDQRTALCAASWNGRLDVVRLLLDWGANVDAVDKLKKTALHDAAGGGYLSVVKLLVERGADVRLKNNKGQTASEVARSNRKKNVADWLDSVSPA